MSESFTSDKALLQVALANPNSALAMPQQEFIELYCQPMEDDSWIRCEDIVKLEDVSETEGGEAIKKEILKSYMEDRARIGNAVPPDPILMGMLTQEQFMEEYQHTDRDEDKDKAARYRAHLVDMYRRKNGQPAQEPGRAAEYPTEATESVEAAQYPVEGKEGMEEQAEDVEYPVEDAKAAAPEEENETEGNAESARDQCGKAAPVTAAGSPKAADNATTAPNTETPTAAEGCNGAAAADAEAFADEL